MRRELLGFLATLGMTLAAVLLMGSVASGSTAGLVVVHGDGTSVVKVVEFNETKISGVELLRRSGLTNSIVEGSAGQAVYMIDGEGDPSGWVTEGGRNYYWSYFSVSDGKWQYSKVGAGAAEVGDGDVQGWLWQFYGQNAVFPGVSIPQMNIDIPAGHSGALETAASKTAAKPASREESAKPQDNRTRIIGYAVFAVILLVMGTVSAVLIRVRGQ